MPRTLPAWIAPQLATLVDVAPEGDAWVHETKFDGYRILARRDGRTTTLWSRNRKDWTSRFPSVAHAVDSLRCRNAWIDGEVVVLDAKGISRFQGLQRALDGSRDDDVVYCVFDVPFLDGKDLRGLPLVERKAALRRLIGRARRPLLFSDHVEGQGVKFHRLACRRGLEGIVAKRAAAPYVSARTRDWLKVKCSHEQELVIGGFTEPSGSRVRLGALLVGVHDARGRLLYAGRVGTGFSDATLRSLRSRLGKIETPKPPFALPPTGADARGVHWVKPRLVAQVRFTEWTSDGLLRHPAFLGLREDKPARGIVRES